MTELTDDRLRALYAPIASHRPPSRDGCPSPESILAVIERTGSERDRLLTLDHVMACAACHEDFDLLRAVASAEQRDDSVTPLKTNGASARAGARWMQWGGGLLAASIAIVVSVQVLRAPNHAEVTRGDASAVASNKAISLVSPEVGAIDASRGVTLVWRPVSSAVNYTVEILDNTGRVVLSTSTNDSVVVFPNAAQSLTSGASYKWWVRASTLSGAEEQSSLRDLNIK